MQSNALIISREYNMTSHNGKTLTATIKDGHTASGDIFFSWFDLLKNI
jgi:hypothetical protein